MHEFSHALAAWLTCNKVKGIEVNSKEGGLTHWEGNPKRQKCSKCFVLPAGYLGSALWGVAIIISCVTPFWARVMGCVLCGALFVCLMYALCGKTSEERCPLICVSIGFGSLIGALTFCSWFVDWHGFDLLLVAVLLFVGTLNALYGTLDIYDDTVKRTDTRSDAYQCADMCCCSAKLVGCVWFILAIGAFGTAIWAYLLLQQESGDTPDWVAYLPGPILVGMAVLHRAFQHHRKKRDAAPITRSGTGAGGMSSAAPGGARGLSGQV